MLVEEVRDIEEKVICLSYIHGVSVFSSTSAFRGLSYPVIASTCLTTDFEASREYFVRQHVQSLGGFSKYASCLVRISASVKYVSSVK
jgi:hypothetical protein